MVDTAISTSNYGVIKNRKFWIADLLKLYHEQEQFDKETKTYSKTNTASNIISRIKTLSVVGVVVGLRNEKHEKLDMRSIDAYESNRPVVYDIDDGTGVITAVHFMKKRIEHQNCLQIPSAITCLEKSYPYTKSREQISSGASSIYGFIQKTKKAVLQTRSSYAIGSCVEVKGCIQYFQDRPQLLAFSVREIDDPNLEMKQYIRMDNLKKNVYPKLFDQNK